jgi:hypothetical protein
MNLMQRGDATLHEIHQPPPAHRPRAPCRGVAWRWRRVAVARQPGMPAVTVISITSSGAFSDATVTVVRAGLSVGKYFAYSSL